MYCRGRRGAAVVFIIKFLFSKGSVFGVHTVIFGYYLQWLPFITNCFLSKVWLYYIKAPSIYIYIIALYVLILQFQHLIDKVFHNFWVLQSQFCCQYLISSTLQYIFQLWWMPTNKYVPPRTKNLSNRT